ncbi:hypothetical protein ACWGJ2_36305 [Streptomyces sp. NPDC054796]
MLGVAPDARAAACDEDTVAGIALSVLAASGTEDAHRSLHGPALVAAAHAAQSADRPGRPGRTERIRVHGPDVRAAVVPEWIRPGPLSLSPVGPPAPHLDRSVSRALASLPRTADPGTCRLAAWRDDERAVLDESTALLRSAWPELLAELREGVTEVALLDGHALDGFTDFVTHGAVFIRRGLLTPGPGHGPGPCPGPCPGHAPDSGPDVLPGPVRFAEALTREGTRTRCNAAAVSTPFLVPSGEDAGGPAVAGARQVPGPLRGDPRPVAGLFQEVLALVRRVTLYERLWEVAELAHEPLSARRCRLLERAVRAVDALRGQSSLLTSHGLGVLAEAEEATRLSHGWAATGRHV